MAQEDATEDDIFTDEQFLADCEAAKSALLTCGEKNCKALTDSVLGNSTDDDMGDDGGDFDLSCADFNEELSSSSCEVVDQCPACGSEFTKVLECNGKLTFAFLASFSSLFGDSADGGDNEPAAACLPLE